MSHGNDVHSSFSSLDGVLGMQMMDAVQKSGAQYTGMHDSAQNTTWFATWLGKAAVATYAVIIFSDNNRARFTHALMLEGLALLQLHEKGEIRLMVWDPSKGHNAANIRATILDDAAGMGNIAEYIVFVRDHSSTAAVAECSAALRAVKDTLLSTSSSNDTNHTLPRSNEAFVGDIIQHAKLNEIEAKSLSVAFIELGVLSWTDVTLATSAEIENAAVNLPRISKRKLECNWGGQSGCGSRGYCVKVCDDGLCFYVGPNAHMPRLQQATHNPHVSRIIR